MQGPKTITHGKTCVSMFTPLTMDFNPSSAAQAYGATLSVIASNVSVPAPLTQITTR